jgi:hypothetical protein
MSSSCAVERTHSAHFRVPAVFMKCCDADIQLSFAKRIPGWDGSGRDGRVSPWNGLGFIALGRRGVCKA